MKGILKMNYVKHSAISFAKSIKLKDQNRSLKKLTVLLTKNGYVIRDYSKAETVLMSFALLDDSRESDSVSAVDQYGVPHLFIDDSLPSPKQLFALAHEVGHIVLKHRKTYSLRRKQEREANLFAHYFLSYNNHQKTNTPILISAIILCLSIIILIISFLKLPEERLEVLPSSQNITVSIISAPDETIPGELVGVEPGPDEPESIPTPKTKNNEEYCYYTPSGVVYHIYEDCGYIRNSHNTHYATIKQSGKSRICSACERRLNDD